MFKYFKANYSWDLALVITVETGGNLCEIAEYLESLREREFDSAVEANTAWFEAWAGLADRVERLARADEDKGRSISAGEKYLRAGGYRLLGERMLPRHDRRWAAAYQRGIDTVYKGARMRGDDVESMNIPYEDSTLPALFIRSPGDEPAPCLILFNGFDSNKEWFYTVVREAVTRRRMHCLIVDQPGTGGAIRLNRLPGVPESERAVSACIDALSVRSEVDANRIGMWGISLGGYFAPRAAAFEHRIKACVAWGALWDFGEVLDAVASRSIKASMPDMLEHAMWTFGASTRQEALEIARRMTLVPVIDKVRCPLLVVHGENDQQVALSQAVRTYEGAVGASSRELKVFKRTEGGAEHCQVDNLMSGVAYMTDWFAEQLGGTIQG